jgi:hypothetical protein
MGRVEVLTMREVRFAKRCWVSVGGVDVDEVVVVKVGNENVVGVVDDWYAAPAHAVKRLLAKLLNVKEEDISLKC